MNDAVLYALAEVAAAMAAFSGLVVAFRARGARRWSPAELRILWLLVADSFILMLLALLPVPLDGGLVRRPGLGRLQHAAGSLVLRRHRHRCPR